MRFGAMNFPIKPLLAEIDAFAALDMDYLELAMDPPQAHFSLIRRQRRSIRRALRQHGMGLVCHLPTFVYTADLTDSIRKASIRETLSSLETAADLEAEKVVLHPGYISGLAVHVMAQGLAKAMESLGIFVRRAAQLGIDVCIENMFPKYRPFVTPDDFRPVFEAFPELKFTLDTGHAHMGDETGGRALAFIARYGERLLHLHVSDNSGQADEHLPVGRGTISFETLMEALVHMGYDGTLTLEVFSPDRANLTESRRRLCRMLSEARAGSKGGQS